jgi:uncharacterized protein with GYD domain
MLCAHFAEAATPPWDVRWGFENTSKIRRGVSAYHKSYQKGEDHALGILRKTIAKGVKGMIAEPQNRAVAVGKLVQALGGKLISYHLLLNGEIDFFIVTDMPEDKIADVAMVNTMLVRGSGAIKSITSVPAVRAEDAVPIMQKAQKMSAAMAYKAPSKT